MSINPWARPTATGFIPNGGGSLNVLAAADHNADGRADLGFDGPTSNKITLMAADGISEQSSFFPPNAGGAARLNFVADTNGDGSADLISVFMANEEAFLQTVLSSTVSGSAVLPAQGRVLFVP